MITDLFYYVLIKLETKIKTILNQMKVLMAFKKIIQIFHNKKLSDIIRQCENILQDNEENRNKEISQC